MGPSASKRPVVLIVEDDLLLRIDAVAMIEAAGFDVVEAASADDAIKILEARRDITVVFTDIQMPGSDGRSKTRPCGQGPLAADQDRRDFRLCGCRGKGSAGGRAVFGKAVPGEQNSPMCCAN